MTYRAPPQGRGDRRLNTTNYEHPQETNLLDLHRAMEYNSLGQPVIRTTSGAAVTANDSFGRLRVSNPFTLFDEFFRYSNEGRAFSNTAVDGTLVHDINASSVMANVTTASGSRVYRETKRVFAYQPGKSLQILKTFVFNPAKTNLRQRIGYFGTSDGIYFQLENTTLSWVRRYSTSGAVQEEIINQSSWNVDPLDGTGVSTKVLDPTKAQIMWIDIEWLGVGSVRVGFVIDGEFVQCHQFNHANVIDNVYMKTACLPVRAEIENIGATTSNSSLREICTTVISEGGYQITGRGRAVGHDLNGAYDLASPNTFYPVLSIRLKTDRLDSIVVPQNFSIAFTQAANYEYKIVVGGVTAGGSWISAGNDTTFEYNRTGTSFNWTNAANVELGFVAASNQTSVSPALDPVPFFYQLERNSFTANAVEFSLLVRGSGTNDDIFASIQVDEFTT